DDDLSPFLLIHGTFDVDEIGSSAYTLKTVDDEDIPELDPKGPDDEARCTADDAQDRIGVGGNDPAEESSGRGAVRDAGGGSGGSRRPWVCRGPAPRCRCPHGHPGSAPAVRVGPCSPTGSPLCNHWDCPTTSKP